MLTGHTTRVKSPTAAAAAPRLASVVVVGGRDESAVLAFAAGAAEPLGSPWAPALVESARQRRIEMPRLGRVRHASPAGIAAEVGGHSVALGSRALFEALSISLEALGRWPQRLEQRGEQVLLVAIDGRAAGLVGLAGSARPMDQTESDMEEAVSNDRFPFEPAGLPAVRSVEPVPLEDGDEFELRLAPVTRRIGNAELRLLAYNGSIPGPTLQVRQGTSVLVRVVNDGDLETTVHWHGLRIENRYDGTRATQRPIPVGGTFTYRLSFPDPGVYWYHPHIREDYGQELGLYGNIVVLPSEPGYWGPAHRELAVTLDDILLEGGRVAPFNRLHPTYTAMGRFGNVMLANGEPALSLEARLGEVVRLYLTNTANTRVFDIGVRGARMKLVGGDSGRCERESFVDGVVLAPSERAVVDVLFDRAGDAALEHRTPGRTYRLGTVTVASEAAEPDLRNTYAQLRVDDTLVAMREALAPLRGAEPAKTLALVAEMDMGAPDDAGAAALHYVCPMHPDVISGDPGRCPRCGMKLLPSPFVEAAGHGDTHAPAAPADAEQAGIEWEDDMVDVNRLTTPANMRWKLIDRDTGLEGDAIDWRFRVGQQVKIRIVNEMDSDHPMHHPFHVHGAGRFLVLARDGREDRNLVWKDTVLVRTGETVDILLDVSHPGVWMAHCHIAEHHESGMMLRFRVNR
ncbi:MAG TPA: multicopper oxidase domain-containing protein [Vicinamibacterales bacterium]|nr:multicopper oxidase domain-containing protein [Vicinamibacterales bacterium]